MLKSSSNRAYLVPMVLSAACWGLATVMSKGLLGYIPPMTLLVIQLSISLIFLWGMVAIHRLGLPVNRRTLRLGLLGVLNPGLAYTFSLLGLTLTTASMSTLLWAAEPILILGLAWAILREHVTPPLVALSGVALAGVFLVAGVEVRTGLNSSLPGNLLTLAGVGCCALYTVLTRREAESFAPLPVVALQQTCAWVWALIIWPIEWLSGDAVSVAAIGSNVWIWAAASGVTYYGLAFWFYITALKKTSASLAGLFLNLIPIFGVGGAYLFLNERLTAVQWAGAGMILAAVVSIVRLGNPATRAAQ